MSSRRFLGNTARPGEPHIIVISAPESHRANSPASAAIVGVVVAVLALTFAPACGDSTKTEPSPSPEGAPPDRGASANVPAPPADDDGGETSSRDNDDTAASDEPSASLFLGEDESERLEALATQEIVGIEKGRGGRSLAFKLTLADGTVAYFKPEQSFSAAHFFSEIAAYHLDRELGIGRVPTTVGRRVEWAPLRRAAGGDERLSEIAVADDGTVRGAMIGWVDGGLERLDAPDNWALWVRVDPSLMIDPYMRPVEWSAQNRRGGQPAGRGGEVSAPANPAWPRELSEMVLFDYLTSNVDRWGGDFTNVRTRGVGGPLVYLDNGAGFSRGPTARIPLMDARLSALQRYPTATAERIRTLDRAALESRLEADPLGNVLSNTQLDQLFERRDAIVEHVAALQQRFGETAIIEP